MRGRILTDQFFKRAKGLVYGALILSNMSNHALRTRHEETYVREGLFAEESGSGGSESNLSFYPPIWTRQP
jgi:hypothetical protein